MTFDDIVNRLALSESSQARSLIESIQCGEIAPVGLNPGRDSAKTLAATFAVRAQTSRAAGIRVQGLDSVVRELGGLPAQTPVVLYSFAGSKRVFIVFVRDADEHILGVIAVERRPVNREKEQWLIDELDIH